MYYSSKTSALSLSTLFLLLTLTACVDNQAEELVSIVNQENSAIESTESPNVVSTIEISKPEVILNLGNSETLTVLQSNSRGASVTLSESPDWKSESPTIASIDSQGVVTARAVGSTTITASWRGLSDSTTITVEDAVLLDFTVAPTSLELDECQSTEILANALYSDGSTQSLPGSVDWSLEGLNTGSILSEGDSAIIRTPASGMGLLILSYGEVSSSTPVTVKDTLESLTFNNTSFTIPLGSKVDLSVLGNYTDGSTGLDVHGSEWSVEHPVPDSPAISVAQTDENTFMLNALELGAATLNIYCGGVTLSQEFEVVPVPTLTSIQILDGLDIDLLAGEIADLTIDAFYSDGHTETVGTDITWSLNNNEHQAFSLSLTDTGSMQLTTDTDLSFEHQAELQAEYKALVVTIPIYALRDIPDILNSISFVYIDSIGNEFQLIEGTTQTLPALSTMNLEVNAVFQTESIRVPAEEVVWSNSDPAIATVGADGVVSALTPGNATISAHYQDLKIDLPLLITP